ncbi:MAG TPA: SDR family oxidoreductase [Solirubrobacter sp.]|nr:SDR family oxidoreductase [Solirubrobacter sp.]
MSSIQPGAGRLAGKIAVVTGSSSGNGRAIAVAFAREGASVVCSDIRREAREGGYEGDIQVPTDEVVAGFGVGAEYRDCDTTKADQVQALIDTAVESFGRVDIMVNNAGVFTELHTIVDETEAQWDFTMAVNAKGVFLGCKAAITQMLAQPDEGGESRGKVINIASIGGLVGLAAEPAYCASKGAVVNLTRQLAVDFAPERINVNAICPGFLATAMVRPFLDDPELNRTLHDNSPWPNLGTAEDVADMAVFLAGDESRWVSGANLTVDGAYTAG